MHRQWHRLPLGCSLSFRREGGGFAVEAGVSVEDLEDIALEQGLPLGPCSKFLVGLSIDGGIHNIVTIFCDLCLAYPLEKVLEEGLQSRTDPEPVCLQSQCKHQPHQLPVKPASAPAS